MTHHLLDLFLVIIEVAEKLAYGFWTKKIYLKKLTKSIANPKTTLNQLKKTQN